MDSDQVLTLMKTVAAEVITPRFRSLADGEVMEKNPGDLVTVADHESEAILTRELTGAYPDAFILGEERTSADPTTLERYLAAEHAFTVDPVDGTKNFVRGVPIWATLIALMEGDQVVVGMVSAPALGRRWWAARGHGAFAGRHRAAATAIRVSGVSRLSDASLCYSELREWAEAGRLDGMLDLVGRCWRTRGYGDFYGYVLVAEGAVDVMAEPELSLWDMAALVPIVTEAGGTFTDLAGQPGPAGGSAVATNGKLHEDVLDRLGSAR